MSLARISYATVGLVVIAVRKAQESKTQVRTLVHQYTDELKNSLSPVFAKSAQVPSQRTHLEQRIDEGIQVALTAMGIPKQEDVRKVYEKLHELTEKVKKVVITA